MTSSKVAALTTAFLLAFGSANARIGSSIADQEQGRRNLRENCSGSSMLDTTKDYKICHNSDTSLCWKVRESDMEFLIDTFDSSDDTFKFSFVKTQFHCGGDWKDRVKIQVIGHTLKARDLDGSDGEEIFKVSVGEGQSCSLTNTVKFSYFDDDTWVNTNKWLKKDNSSFDWKENSGQESDWRIIEI